MVTAQRCCFAHVPQWLPFFTYQSYALWGIVPDLAHRGSDGDICSGAADHALAYGRNSWTVSILQSEQVGSSLSREFRPNATSVLERIPKPKRTICSRTTLVLSS